MRQYPEGQTGNQTQHIYNYSSFFSSQLMVSWVVKSVVGNISSSLDRAELSRIASHMKWKDYLTTCTFSGSTGSLMIYTFSVTYNFAHSAVIFLGVVYRKCVAFRQTWLPF